MIMVMSQSALPPITELLIAWQKGDPDALAKLMPMVCDELRRMARCYLSRETDKDLLQPTVLVNELFLFLHGRRKVAWKNRAHFFGFAAQTMRRFLVDHARGRNRLKHGAGEQRFSLGPEHEQLLGLEPDRCDILAIHQVLERLEARDPRMAEIVKLRYFLGMTVEETAAALDISAPTVKREWSVARIWLYNELQTVVVSDRDEDGTEASMAPCKETTDPP